MAPPASVDANGEALRAADAWGVRLLSGALDDGERTVTGKFTGVRHTAGEKSRQQVGVQRGGSVALAHGLLLEAVDCIWQARDLIDDDEARAVLSRHAEDLTRFADRLPRPG